MSTLVKLKTVKDKNQYIRNKKNGFLFVMGEPRSAIVGEFVMNGERSIVSFDLIDYQQFVGERVRLPLTWYEGLMNAYEKYSLKNMVSDSFRGNTSLCILLLRDKFGFRFDYTQIECFGRYWKEYKIGTPLGHSGYDYYRHKTPTMFALWLMNSRVRNFEVSTNINNLGRPELVFRAEGSKHVVEMFLVGGGGTLHDLTPMGRRFLNGLKKLGYNLVLHG